MAAPAHADVSSPQLESLLGKVSYTTDGPDEFRADFAIRVPHGDTVTSVQYEYTPSAGNWVTAVPIANIQTGIDQQYQVVHVTRDGADDILYISVRGDSDVGGVSSSVQMTQNIRVTTGTGTVTFGHSITNVSRNSTTGRPVAIEAWDTTTAGLPGYLGPNSEAGWGNVVASGSGASVPGGKFHVDALNSGRAASVGCDQTTAVYVQFVHADGTPSSVTPNPIKVTIPNNSGSVQGTLLSSLGNITFDSPDYYKLLAWPQASSSSPSAPQDCSAVSYTPGDLAEAQQIGSVFWQLPDTATPAKPAPPTAKVTGVDSSNAATVAGTGVPGATVTVSGPGGDKTTTVDAQGNWTLTYPKLPNGQSDLTVTQTVGGQTSDPVTVTAVAKPDAPTAQVTDIDSANNATVEGTGVPGATVTVSGPNGNRSTVVDNQGNWTLTYPKLPDGKTDLTVTQTLGGQTSDPTTVTADTGLAAPTMHILDHTDDPGSATVGGTGIPGATVTVTGPAGPQYATVDAQGNWSLVYPGLPTGTSTLTATQCVNGQVSKSVSVEVNINGSPVLDPRVGLPALALVGAVGAGAALSRRRRLV